MLKVQLILTTLLLSALSLCAQPKIQLQQYASGFTKPVEIANCGDKRLFIVEQRGYIWVLDSMGNKLSTPFLNIDPRVNSNGNEQGLLGLAFPPDYAEKGYFYVNYTQANGNTRISRFSVLENNPNEADPNSEAILINITQPFSNHNGGCIKFGPDGYLYISQGDGGSGGDPQGNGQNKGTMLGKMLRIDVNVDTMPYYTSPSDNPFVGAPNSLPEIWSYGLRNVWRFSFDRLTGDIWIADVGQNIWEEINFEPANTGGLNYGWRCYEADANYNTGGCGASSEYVFPIFKYNHSVANGCSVTGGFIYRGSKYPAMYGKYIFPDYCSGRWWVITPNADGSFSTEILANLSAYEYTALGEDMEGELYVTGHSTGRIYKIVELCSGFAVSGTSVDATCSGSGDGNISLEINGGTTPYAVSWTSVTPANSLEMLNPGDYSVTVQDANQCQQILDFTIGESFPIEGSPTISITSTPEVLCPDANNTVSLMASAPLQPGLKYQWSLDNVIIPDSLGPVFHAAIPGDYKVSWLRAAIGCTSTPSAAVTVLAENAGPFDPLTFNEDGLLDIGTQGWPPYQWYYNGTLVPGATSSTFAVIGEGVYTVTSTSPAGCTYEIGTTVVLISTALPEWVSAFAISPNPAGPYVLLDIQLPEFSNLEVGIWDVHGKLQRTAILKGNNLKHQFDVSGLPAGTYACYLKTEKGIVVRKMVKL